uniref:TFIIE-A_C domain-containing protein n=1 Tax=Macrostomum lignano TaxID=282301 RepID=A0A1I8FJU7_9PLAT
METSADVAIVPRPLDALLKEIERFRFGPSLLERALTEFARRRPGPPGARRPNQILPGFLVFRFAAWRRRRASSATITVDMSLAETSPPAKPASKRFRSGCCGSTIALDEDSNSRFSLDGGGGVGRRRRLAGSGLDIGAQSGDSRPAHTERGAPKEAQEQQKKQQQQQQPQAAGFSKSKKKKKPAKSSDDEDDEDDDDNRSEFVDLAVHPLVPRRLKTIPRRRLRRFEDDDEDDDDDSDDDDLSVTFQGKRIPYDEVTEQMVQQMNPEGEGQITPLLDRILL